MTEYRFVSGKVVIDRIFQDYPITNADWVGDAFDWIGDVIEAVNKNHLLETIVVPCKIDIVQHRGIVPSYLYAVMGVTYKGKPLNLGGDASGYGIIEWNKKGNLGEVNEDVIAKIDKLSDTYEVQFAYWESLPPGEDKDKAQQAYEKTLSEINKWTPQVDTAKNPYLLRDSEYYSLDGNVIITSFEEGSVKMFGKRFKLDCDGFPMILDVYEFKQAVIDYILLRLLMKGHKILDLNWREQKAIWLDSRKKASNAIKMPGLARLERFKTMWTRLKFDAQAGKHFFINAEKELRTYR